MVFRRLIAPTMITLVMIGLWADYLLFRDSPWSAVNFLSKVLAILVRIFAPLFDPALYWWIGEIIVPVVMIPCGIILLYISVAKAKVAMSRATPSADDDARILPLLAKATPAADGDLNTETALPKLAAKPWKLGLVGKLAASFAALSLLFGVAATVITYRGLSGTLENEVKQRANVFVLSLSDIASRNGLGQGNLEMRNAVEKFGSSRSVAYIYVEDGAGEIVAHQPRDLPLYLLRDFPKSAERALKGIELDYRGLPVFETSMRVAGGQGGYVHLALWRDAFEEENRQVLTPVAASTLIILAGVTAAFTWAMWNLINPFMTLVDRASRISKGELDLDMGLKETDEVGDLARSFDRMRSSLHAVLTRLEIGEFGEQPNEQDGHASSE
ncbi:MAG: HAMP domain-containing protein [Candidatus Binatia bacterium]